MKDDILLAAALFVTMSVFAHADETGLAAIHDWRQESGHTCMSGHFHDGSGTGQSRKAAEASAISSWASFTILEYGTDWGGYGLAAGKKMTCSESGAKSWSCDLSARPCKRSATARASTTKRRKAK